MVLWGLAIGIAASSSLVLLVPPVVLGAGWFFAAAGPLGDDCALAPLLSSSVINTLMALPFVVPRAGAGQLATHAARTGKLAVSLGLGGMASPAAGSTWPGLQQTVADGAVPLPLRLVSR